MALLPFVLFLCAVCIPPTIGRTLIAAGDAFGDEHGFFAGPFMGRNSKERRRPMVPIPKQSSLKRPSMPGDYKWERRLGKQKKRVSAKTEKRLPSEIKSDAPPVVQKPVVERKDAGEGKNSTDGGGLMKILAKKPEKKVNGSKSAEERKEEFFRKVHNVPCEEAHVMEMVQHWAEQAFSNLFAVVAEKRLKQFEKPVHEEFGECSKRAKTVPMHAKCVSDLLSGRIDGEKVRTKDKQKSHRFDKYRMNKRVKLRKEMALQRKKAKNENWIGGFRMMDSPLPAEEERSSASWLHIAREYATNRRERRQTGVVKKNYYELLTPSEGRVSPMGKIAQMMMKGVLKAKGKHQNDVLPWQKTVMRIKESADKRKAIKKRLEHDSVESMDQLTYRGLKRQGVVKEDLSDVIGDPKNLQKFLHRKQKQKGKGKPIDRFMSLMREGLKLGYAFAGKNMSEVDQKSLKMVSPRFLSVTPEDDQHKNETIDFLSPSLFSMHNKGQGLENLTSIPNMLKNVGGLMGFSAKDQQLWLDFIMEAAGVVEDADKIEKELNETAGEDPVKTVWEKHYDKDKYEREIRAKDGTPLYFTKQNISDAFGESETRKVDMFERLQKMMSRDQVKDMNGTGYALMSREQLDLLYGPGSEYHDPEALGRFKSLDRSTLLAHIERDIHSLAQIKSFKITRKQPNTTALAHPRSRRAVVLSPIYATPFILQFLVGNPIILSPILFSVLLLTPVALGPVILSPWLFVPIILAPRVLSPLILSPVAFAPVVLSPLALHPVILSPGAFVPVVLTPIVLSPFIMSPQVFTPLILSPFALTPFILNPSAASPIVLSPFVLSPAIYSPTFLTGVILSPYALSPVIYSPSTWAVVILSPSWLS